MATISPKVGSLTLAACMLASALLQLPRQTVASGYIDVAGVIYCAGAAGAPYSGDVTTAIGPSEGGPSSVNVTCVDTSGNNFGPLSWFMTVSDSGIQKGGITYSYYNENNNQFVDYITGAWICTATLSSAPTGSCSTPCSGYNALTGLAHGNASLDTIPDYPPGVCPSGVDFPAGWEPEPSPPPIYLNGYNQLSNNDCQNPAITNFCFTTGTSPSPSSSKVPSPSASSSMLPSPSASSSTVPSPSASSSNVPSPSASSSRLPSPSKSPCPSPSKSSAPSPQPSSFPCPMKCCSPDFWKFGPDSPRFPGQHRPDHTCNNVFGITGSTKTLAQALENVDDAVCEDTLDNGCFLGHATAALLNAAAWGEWGFLMTEAEVLYNVQNAVGHGTHGSLCEYFKMFQNGLLDHCCH